MQEHETFSHERCFEVKKKVRVILDLEYKSKSKFEYNFKFINISHPGVEVNLADLVDHLKQIIESIEKQQLETGNFSTENKSYH